MEKAQ